MSLNCALMPRKLQIAGVACACLLALTLVRAAWADIAPPEQPPGSSLSPAGQTQVRMLAEQVVIAVRSRPSGPEKLLLSAQAAEAHVRADFRMHNLGAADERMQVRFPLRDLSGRIASDSHGFAQYLEVQDFAASVGGQPVATTVITTPNPQGGDAPPIRWAAFDVTFPAAQDLRVGVTYAITPTGYFPAARFAYLLETGAGWRGSIGSVDIIVQLPYAASAEYVLPGLDGMEQGRTSPGGRFIGNEIRWHWDNIEPTAQDNFFVTLLVPRVWQAILDARAASVANPTDVAALVRLAQAYNAAATSRFPTETSDPFAALSEQAYERAIALQPDSAALHADFAWLLWNHLAVQALLPVDDPVVQHILREVSTALALDPQNAQAKALVEDLKQGVEGEVVLATPSSVATATAVPASTTSVPPPAASPAASALPSTSTALAPSAAPATAAPASRVPAVGLAPTPISAQPAGGAGTLPLLLGLIVALVLIVGGVLMVVRRRRQR